MNASLVLTAVLAVLHPAHVDVLPAASETARATTAIEEGPRLLETLLARYDALADGPEKDALERRIDEVAGQRYATFSRLYWYRDLPSAQSAARASGRPILSLRMLGRLDENESCANSRLFRVVLYANEELSRFLRENFVLHWSSERPVPKVVVDFGDGRTLHTTLAGNSAHFVLDAEGRPVDVLPGLYDPVSFRTALEEVLPFARESAGLESVEHVRRGMDVRHGSHARAMRDWNTTETQVLIRAPASAIAAAEEITLNKRAMEMPLVAGLESEIPARLRMYVPTQRLADARLDARSRALVARLAPTDRRASPAPLVGAALESLVARFEELIVLDTRNNALSVRPQVHALMESLDPWTLDELCEFVYRDVFRTPREDPWLGLVSGGAFSALPGDGLRR